MRRYGFAAALLLVCAACGADDSDASGLESRSANHPWSGAGKGAGGGGPPPSDPGGGGAMGQPEDWHEGENYTSYGENDFTDPAEDALCTFGIDVDTGSYTLMRRDVRAGMLPAAAGVRTEEYLNYFDYDYEPPAQGGDEAFAIHLDGAPSPFGEGLHLLRIGIKGREVPLPERPQANLVFLVDVSGSMGTDDKLGLVKRSLRMLVDELRADDTIGLVVYAGASGVVLEPTPVAERETILTAIDDLDSGGSTNGEAGIRNAYDLAEAHFVEGGINRVVLATDGDMNVGLTGDALVDLVVEFRERGIYLTTLGFGRGNYNDSLMEKLADHGNGNYAYVDSDAEAERIFRRELLGTLIVIARDVKIQVEIDVDAVARYRLLGYENRAIDDEDFEEPDVDTGDIGSGHDVTALIELELRAEAGEPGLVPAQVATVRVRYDEPDGVQELQVERTIDTSGFATSIDAASPGLRFATAVAEYAEILRRSSHSEGARFSEVIELASGAAEKKEDRLEFLELAGMAQGLWQAQFGGAD